MHSVPALSSPRANESIYWTDNLKQQQPLDPGTVLDPLETSTQTVRSDLERIKRAVPTDTAFRHSGWQDDRARILRALHELREPPERFERFVRCGSHAYVQADVDDPDHLRVRCDKCRDRLCLPCQRERRLRLARNLVEKLANHRLRFLTVTLKSSARPLAEQIDRLYACWTNFRRRKPIKKLMTGGVSFLELAYNPDTRRWHPHLHTICEGSYLPHDLISKTWHDVTGDSFIVRIQALRNLKTAAGYVTKYASKLIPAEVIRDPVALREAIPVVSARRSIATFGTFTHLGLGDKPKDDTTWETIAPLSEILRRDICGDPDAHLILVRLALYSRLDRDAADNPTEQYHDLDAP